MGEEESTVRGGVVLLPAGVIVNSMSEKTKLAPIDLSSDGYNPQASLFLLENAKFSSIVEIMHFAPPFGSWMYVSKDKEEDPEIEEKGTLSFVTAVDPLFCALGLLEHRRSVSGTNMFQPLDALLHFEQSHNFPKMCSAAQVALICEVKDVGDESFYRLDDERVFIWLECKIDNLEKGSKLSRQNAVDTISQYLSEPWDKKFTERFAEKPDTQASEKPHLEASKDLNGAQEMALAAILSDAKKENDIAQTEDRRPKDAPSAKKRKTAKKPSTTGMTTRSSRPITSFFSKK